MNQPRFSKRLTGKAVSFRVPLPAHEIAVRAGLRSSRPNLDISSMVEPLELVCEDLDPNLTMTMPQRRRTRSILVDWVSGAADFENLTPKSSGHESEPVARLLIVVTGISPDAISATCERLLEGSGNQETAIEEVTVGLNHPAWESIDPRENVWAHEDRGDAALMAAGFISFGPENRWHVPTYCEHVATAPLEASTDALLKLCDSGLDGFLTASASYLERIQLLATRRNTVVVVSGLGPDGQNEDAVTESIEQRCAAVAQRRRIYSTAFDDDRTTRYVEWRMRQAFERYSASLDEMGEKLEQRAGDTDALFFSSESALDDELIDALLTNIARKN